MIPTSPVRVSRVGLSGNSGAVRPHAGTRRVEVNRVKCEACLVHTGLSEIIAGLGPTVNAICRAVNANDHCTQEPKIISQKERRVG
jgi:hypothetical protein